MKNMKKVLILTVLCLTLGLGFLVNGVYADSPIAVSKYWMKVLTLSNPKTQKVKVTYANNKLASEAIVKVIKNKTKVLIEPKSEWTEGQTYKIILMTTKKVGKKTITTTKVLNTFVIKKSNEDNENDQNAKG